MSKTSSYATTIAIAIIALLLLGQVQRMAERAYSTVNRDAAISTVTGGEYEFNAQQAAKEGGNLVNGAISFSYILIIAFAAVKVYKITQREEKEEKVEEVNLSK